MCLDQPEGKGYVGMSIRGLSAAAVLLAFVLTACTHPPEGDKQPVAAAVNGFAPAPLDTPIAWEGQFTPLHIAAVRGDVKAARTLLNRGADIDAKSRPDGMTPLYYAAAYGRPEMVRLLIRRGARAFGDGPEIDTPLHAAAWNGHAKALAEILRSDPRINALDLARRTPIQDALRWDRGEAVSTLMDYGAEPWLEAGEPLAPMDPAYSLAAWAIGNRKHSVASCSIARMNRLDATGPHGRTLLHICMEHRDADTAKRLLKSGASPDCANTEGHTPAHTAVNRKFASGIRVLAEAGADLNATDPKGRTPTHLSVMEQREECLSALIEAGADLEIPDSECWPPLLRASHDNLLVMAKILVEGGASVEGRHSQNGFRPLHVAASEAMVHLLVEAGAEIDARSRSRQTPLMLAATGKIVDLLVARGAAVDAGDEMGWTAIHHAVKRNSLDVVAALAKAGAEVNAVTAEGQTPMAMAKDWKMANLLKQLGAKQPNPFQPPLLSLNASRMPHSSFFGVGGNAHHVIYVIDASASSSEAFASLRRNVHKSISRLHSSQFFVVTAVQNGKILTAGDGVPVSAKDENKTQAAEFLEELKPGTGQNRLWPAIERAIETLNRPDGPGSGKPGFFVFVLSDGRCTDRYELPAKVKAAASKHSFFLNTYLYGLPTPVIAKFFPRVAEAGHGRHRYVEMD